MTLVLVACEFYTSWRRAEVAGSPVTTSTPLTIQLVPGWTWSDLKTATISGAIGSVVTGQAENVSDVVRAGSRAPGAPVADVKVEVLTKAEVDPGGGVPRIIAGVDERGSAALRPLIIAGLGVSGSITSASTKRAGLVDITDLAPTVTASSGRPEPPAATGRRIYLMNERRSTAELAAVDRTVRFYETVRPPLIAVYVGVQGVVYLGAYLLSRSRSRFPGVSLIARCVAALPLASYLLQWVIGTKDVGFVAWSALLALGVGIIGAMSGLATKDARSALRRILLITPAFLLVDVLLGSRLQFSGIFGSSPLLGARYHGLGNPALALLLVSLILWSSGVVKPSFPRRWLAGLVGAVWIVASLAVGLPGLGSDLGGLVVMAFAGVLMVSVAGGLTLGWRAVAIAGGSSVFAVAAVGLIDYLRPENSRSHLGNLVADVVHSGMAPLTDVVQRKVEANVFGYGFPWTMAVIVLALGAVGVLARGGWAGALPIGSPARAGVVVAIVASFIAYSVNDSGIVVLALVAVFVGPFVMVEFEKSLNPTHESEVSVQ